jgi:hypothetical protein
LYHFVVPLEPPDPDRLDDGDRGRVARGASESCLPRKRGSAGPHIDGHVRTLKQVSTGRTIGIVAKGSRELAEPHECSPSKPITPMGPLGPLAHRARARSLA